MKKQPSPAIRVPQLDVGEVREASGMSQEAFARRFGLRVESVRSWEEGRTRPCTVHRILMAIIASHPEVVDEVLRVPDPERWHASARQDQPPTRKALPRRNRL